MNIFFRILLAIYAFFLAIASAASMVVIARPEILDSIYTYLSEQLLEDRTTSIVLFVVAFIFFILSMTFLLSGFRSSRDKKAVSKHTSIGEIQISLNTIENIALAAAKRLNGVKDTKAQVIKQEDNVSIIINVLVLPESNIPALSEDIQTRVKKQVEESSGVNVNEVKVIVENVYAGAVYKPRVE
ncbi:MAG TPA: alkaline shock response membrane anchor protein AmaP [Clostridiaceae bacterium]|nr:alkaline shock response membrane anchor protein AmaP [Clostridiaceae bacterium]